MRNLRIVAPLSEPEEVHALASAGADEFYCGVLPSAWEKLFGSSDRLTRRQGRIANVTSLESLEEIVHLAESVGVPIALTLNVRYTKDQLPSVLEIIHYWESIGGNALLVSDLSLLIALKTVKTGLKIHLSILAAVFNSHAVSFYKDFGITRVVLPRALEPQEMAGITSLHPELEFEVMALNEKCEFIDGFCGFYHGTCYPDNSRSMLEIETDPITGMNSVYSHDTSYAGHGCQIPFQLLDGSLIQHLDGNDVRYPHCAACMLRDLARSGIGLLKIGGRGLPSELKVRSVRFLKTAVDISQQPISNDEAIILMKELYKNTHASPCSPERCYYRKSICNEV